MDWEEEYKGKLMSAQDAVEHIKSWNSPYLPRTDVGLEKCKTSLVKKMFLNQMGSVKGDGT